MSTFSERLREAMKLTGVKAPTLAKRTGLPIFSMYPWMRGEREPQLYSLREIAKALDVNPAWLMGEDVPMQRQAAVEHRKVYIAGKMTGTDDYKERFAAAQEKLERAGYIVLNPAWQPEGLTKADYMRHCMAMLDTADELILLPGWSDSPGAKVEYMYCRYIQKPMREWEECRL